ncbi:WD40/YVTN/BNR-like repeat-containing protein [Actinorhabdospora filicis]|uniref:WD40/YVTN/BNR-like repeat-containing protein n=1 Tax=Actinorhabdospora filicis TaxID=1785913 RepID=UPI002552C27F|nr:sialidase family protein [Actinorhabdospora filicis]
MKHPGAVDFPGAHDYVPPSKGIQKLFPYGPCVLGFGLYSTGYTRVGAMWTGGTGCESLTLAERPANPPHDGPKPIELGTPFGARRDVVDLGDGALLGIGETSLDRRAADGTVTVLGEGVEIYPGKGDAEGSTGFSDLFAEGDLVLIAGRVDWRGRLWRSTDGGRTLAEVTVPGDTSPNLHIIRAGGRLVAVDPWAATALVSTDDGATWTPEAVTGVPPNGYNRSPFIVLEREGGFLAVASRGSEDGGEQAPVVFTSEDGLNWSDTGAAMEGEGSVLDATLDADGRLVIVGNTGSAKEQCGVVWAETFQGWRRGDLGCQAYPARVVTTLADGRVLIAGNTDLWIRQSGPPEPRGSGESSPAAV